MSGAGEDRKTGALFRYGGPDGFPVTAPAVIAAGQRRKPVPGAVEDQDLQVRQVIEKPKSQGRILHRVIEFHPEEIIKLKTEISVL